MKKIHLFMYYFFYTTIVHTSLAAMHESTLLPGSIIKDVQPMRTKTPFWISEQEASQSSLTSDPEKGLFYNATDIHAKSNHDFLQKITNVITRTGSDMLKEMHQANDPLKKNMEHLDAVLATMEKLQQRQRRLSYISYGLTFLTTSYILYKTITQPPQES